MPWVKLDDGFTENPKIEAISDRSFRLYVAGLCYCGRNLTDGVIREDRVRRLLPKVVRPMVDELVGAGVWLPHPEGFEVKDFLIYNPSKEKVVADRAAAAERKRKFIERKNGAGNGVPNGDGNGSPTRPDPARPEGSRAGVSAEPNVNDGPPTPSGGGPRDTKLPVEQVELNTSNVRVLKARIRGDAA